MRTQMKNIESNKEEGLSYVAVQSAPRERVDLMAAFQNLLIGMAGGAALMALGAWMALSVMR